MDLPQLWTRGRERARRELERAQLFVKGDDFGLAMLDLTASETSFDLSSKSGRLESVRALENLFFEVVARFEPAAFLEAGAKAADASRRAAALVPKMRVVAYEANPYTFARFDKKHDYEAEGVSYKHLALASQPGSVSFNVRRREDGRPSADGQGSLLKHRSYAPGHINVTVEASTLDAELAALGARDCALWIDVEGANEEVLGGAARTLEKALVVFIEVEDKALWANQWLSEQVVRVLYEAGLHPIARDYQSRHQHNVLCVRRTRLNTPEVEAALRAYRG